MTAGPPPLKGVVPPFYSIDARARRNGLASWHAGDVKPSSDAVLVIDANHGAVRVYRSKTGNYEGYVRCGHCKKGFTEERPCSHIVAFLLAHGYLVVPVPDAPSLDETVLILPEQRRLFEAVRDDYLWQCLSAFLEAIPETEYEGHRAENGAPRIPRGAIIYAACVYVFRDQNRTAALASLANDPHCANLARLGWVWLRPGDRRALPFQDERIWWFLQHPATANLLDRLLAMCGRAASEFEWAVGWDGKGQQIHRYSYYAEWRTKQLAALRKKDQDPQDIAEEIDNARGLTPEESEKADQARGRKKEFRKAIVGICHTTKVPWAVIPNARPGGEQPYGVPMAVRALCDLGMKTWLMDPGYVKKSLSLFGSRVNGHVFNGYRRNEVLGGGSEAKQARTVELERMWGNPEYYDFMRGQRQAQESGNAAYDCVIGSRLRSRNRLNDNTIDNEIRIRYLALAMYHLGKWRFILEQQLGIRRQADPDFQGDWMRWSSDGKPNFRVVYDAFQARSWHPMSELIERYAGPPKESEAAVAEDFPRTSAEEASEATG